MYKIALLFRPLLLLITVSILSCHHEEKKDASTFTSNDPKIKKLKLPPGFRAERLYSPGEQEQGSWVSMTFDDKGRMIACDQYGSLYRLEIPPIGSDSSRKPKVEKLIVGAENIANKDTSARQIGMGYAHGLLYAFNSLYVMVNNLNTKKFDKTSGLYRLQDTDGDDQFDKITLLKLLQGEGEHGPHSIILSPDKKSLYLVSGNHTDVPEMDTYRLPRNWQEDNLFPLIKDPNGHANNRMAPGGWIAHIDSLGQHWELVGAGFRNAFDIAFNRAGDLFAYDSDMEWDFGMPWYRPTRLCHVTSGAEFGWRTGDSKWSPMFPDNLPAILNIGQGSPTNLIYAENANFPEKYRDALLAFDWSFGIIYAIRLQPDGASYKAQAEEFISGAPLPLTDGLIGPDGALYFLTGGRRLDSDLYRVTYSSDDKDHKEDATPALTAENSLRRQLESYHQPKEGAVSFAWPYLHHKDRYIRYAARIAVEHQPVEEWQSKVLAEKDPVTLIQSVVALARQGKAAIRDQLLGALNGIETTALTVDQKVDLLRAYELVFARMGKPGNHMLAGTTEILDAQYPTKNNHVNRQLSKLLIYLQSPHVVAKTMELMDNAKDDPDYQKTFTASADLIFRNPQYGLDIAGMLSKVPPAQQTYYAVALSAAKTGWTPALREKYFTWFRNAFSYKGGVSFIGFINHARNMALENVPKDRYAYFNQLSGDSLVGKSGVTLASNGEQPKGPGRNWQLDTAVKVVEEGAGQYDFDNGKAMFTASMCSSCHRMRGEGADIGPDLTQLGTRFSTSDILEAIIDPDKTISDQYAATIFYLKDGSSVTGRLMNEDDQKYYVSQNPFARENIREIPKMDVTDKKTSQISIMMPYLLNRLNKEELRNLVAYLMSGGNKDNEIYARKK